MLEKTRVIMNDLIDYLTLGYNGIYSTPINQDSTSRCFHSEVLNNVSYKFLKQYDEVDSLTDDGTHHCVPVLIVQNVDLYKKNKKVLYSNHFIDLATLFYTSDLPSGYPTKRIHFYVVPNIASTSRNVLGTINYDIYIDYDNEYDVYGIMSKEISQILMKHYYRERNLPYYNIITNDYQMYFVPNRIQILNDSNTKFHRIQHYYNIRVCEVR